MFDKMLYYNVFTEREFVIWYKSGNQSRPRKANWVVLSIKLSAIWLTNSKILSRLDHTICRSIGIHAIKYHVKPYPESWFKPTVAWRSSDDVCIQMFVVFWAIRSYLRIMTRTHFPHYCPLVRGIYQSYANFQHKEQPMKGFDGSVFWFG